MHQSIVGPFNDSAVPPLSLEKAIEIFDAQADRDDIAFGYLKDGCYARAHLMCRAFEEQGLSSKKGWVYEFGSELRADLPNGLHMYCDWHVAPVLAVKLPDGKVEDLVFDPSLFNGPVTFDHWRKHFGADEKRSEVTPFGVAPKNSAGDYTPGEKTDSETDKISAELMTEYIKEQNPGPRMVFESALRLLVTPSGNGKTWKAVPALVKTAPTPVDNDDFQNPDFWGAGGCAM